MLTANEIEKGIVDKLSNLNNKKVILIDVNNLSDEALERIAQKLIGGKHENPLNLNLGKNDKSKGITALMKALEASPGIKKITLNADINPDQLLSKTMTVAMSFLKTNHTLSAFTLRIGNEEEMGKLSEDFLSLLYHVLEKHPSIKKLCFYGIENIDLYIKQFYKLSNLETVRVRFCSFFNQNIFFLNLNIPKHFSGYKWDAFEWPINTLVSFLKKINEAKLKKNYFRLPSLNTASETVEPYRLFLKTIRENENLMSLSLMGDGFNSRVFYDRQQNCLIDYFSPKKSYIEELFDFLTETKTLKELKIINIHFMTQFSRDPMNITAFTNALNSNKSLTKLSLKGVAWCSRFYKGHEKYTNKLIDAIFSNSNLKTLEITKQYSGNALNLLNIRCLVKHLMAGHGLTELNLSNCYYEENADKVFAELLENNTTLESLDLSGCKFTQESAVLFLEAIRKNKKLNLRHFDIIDYYHHYWNPEPSRLKDTDKLIQDINIELEKHYQNKKIKIRNILLKGTHCIQSPLKALKGCHGPWGLIFDFLFEKETSAIIRYETKESKEYKESREQNLKMKKGMETWKFIGLKKLNEEVAITKKNHELLRSKNTEAGSFELIEDQALEEMPSKRVGQTGLRYRGKKSSNL